MSKAEVGPVYGVELIIDVLPLNYGKPEGMKQQMPSAADLKSVIGKCTRVAAGYEVLLNHWREQADEIERLRAIVGKLPRKDDIETAMRSNMMGVEEFDDTNCRCDASVGQYCEGCAIDSVLRRVARLAAEARDAS